MSCQVLVSSSVVQVNLCYTYKLRHFCIVSFGFCFKRRKINLSFVLAIGLKLLSDQLMVF